MNPNFLIIDNFLDNPDSVRQSALNADFYRKGPWPGLRSDHADEDYNDYIKSKIEKIINEKIINWRYHYNNEEFDTGCFQLCLKDSYTWIHRDRCEFTGILYLSPDAPVISGTGVFRHKLTGVYYYMENNVVDDKDENSWELISYAGNIYNRLVIFRGCLYHRSLMPGFGDDKYSGRLTQTFFFNTEKYFSQE
jgi:hypothetical protein